MYVYIYMFIYVFFFVNIYFHYIEKGFGNYIRTSVLLDTGMARFWMPKAPLMFFRFHLPDFDYIHYD